MLLWLTMSYLNVHKITLINGIIISFTIYYTKCVHPHEKRKEGGGLAQNTKQFTGIYQVTHRYYHYL